MDGSRSSHSRSSDLVCPSCGRAHPPQERFCSGCGVPLVPSGGEPLEQPLSEAHGRARKINPLYAEGRLVRVAGGRNQAEAELIQGLLLSEGVPSMLRRSRRLRRAGLPRRRPARRDGARVRRPGGARAAAADRARADRGQVAAPRPFVLIAIVVGGGAARADRLAAAGRRHVKRRAPAADAPVMSASTRPDAELAARWLAYVLAAGAAFIVVALLVLPLPAAPTARAPRSSAAAPPRWPRSCSRCAAGCRRGRSRCWCCRSRRCW